MIRLWRGSASAVRLLAFFIADTLAGAVAVACVALLTAGLLLGALTWRLSQGPLDVTAFAGRVAAATMSARPEYAAGPVRVAVQQAVVSWPSFKQGPAAPLYLALSGVQVRDPAGRDLASASRLDGQMDPEAVWTGRAGPTMLAVSDLRIRLSRRTDGSIGFGPDAGTPAGPSSAQGGFDPNGPVPPWLDTLRQATLHNATLEVEDRQLGLTWRVSQIDAEAARGERLSAQISAVVVAGEVRIPVRADAVQTPDRDFAVHAQIGETNPASLAALSPVLAKLAAADVPVSATLDATLAPSLMPRAATVHLAVGTGRVVLPTAAIAVKSADAQLQAAWEGATLARLRAAPVRVVLPSPSGGPDTTIVVDVTAGRADGRIALDVSLGIDQVRFADLPALWPPRTGGGARSWVTENITAGTARDARFAFRIGMANDLSDAVLLAAQGTLAADGLTVHWLRPIPPATAARGRLRLLGPDVLEIDIFDGRQGPVAVRSGLVRIVGLSVRDQVADIAVRLQGGLPAILAVLANPKLKLLSRRQEPINDPAGSVLLDLNVHLPLEHDVDVDQIGIRASAQLSGVRLRRLVAGRDLENGQFRLEASNDGLQVDGQARLAGIAAKLRVALDFRDGPPTQTLVSVDVSGRAGHDQLAAAGADLAGIASGTAELSARYVQLRSKQATAEISADLRDAAVQTPLWSKARGQPAQLRATLRLFDDRLTGIDALRASGPGLLLEGRAETAEGKPSIFRLDRAVLGRTEARGSVSLPQRPNGPVRLVLSGPLLDLTPMLSLVRPDPAAAKRRPQSSGSTVSDQAFDVDIRFGQVLFGSALASPFVLLAQRDGINPLQGSLDAGGLAQGRIVPVAGGREVSAMVRDLGLVLRVLGVTGTVGSGQFTLAGRFDDRQAGSPLSGDAVLEDFRLFDGVVIGKLLQTLTIYGVVDALRGPGLSFSRAAASFTFAGNALTVREGRAFSSSLGMTLAGLLDFGHSRIDMRGTIVPAYILNTLPGRIPLIGRLFSAEPGGGLVAAAVTLRGALDDPSVGVNPLSVLTPGILRRLFNIFD